MSVTRQSRVPDLNGAEDDTGRKASARKTLPDKPTRVVAADVRVWQRVGDVWRYRELLLSLVRKELKIKYKNSTLGFVWSMLNPMLTLIVYYFVFQVVLHNGIPQFALYLLCGLLVWNFFSTALPGATQAVVGNAGIVKKVSFPREVLALAPVGAALFFFGLQALILIAALLVFGVMPAWSYVPLLIPAVAGLVLFASALAIFLSAVNVYLRDTQHLLELVLMAWFWGTPIAYQYQLVANRLPAVHLPTWVFLLNPITPVVITFQRALYARPDPVSATGAVIQLLPSNVDLMWYLAPLLGVIVASGVLYVGALAVFNRLEGNFAEEL
ncbi:MAG: ABC transporter permease [Actinomycetota bacterium]|nr:ABC transporter permease [Actinomycetota bacterium]